MAEITVDGATPAFAEDRRFMGHPIGLAYLAFTEAWERFSFYGMQALLVLYMVDQALKPGHIERILGFSLLRSFVDPGGHLSVQALASAVFGLYTASVYLTPLAGGLIGDSALGRRRAVTLGAIFMAAGHFLMAFEQALVFALLLLILGCGLLKGNLASQVGKLYGPDDHRRDDAFQIYVLAINAGVIAAPLICGTLGEIYGWHYGFTAAGVGMLLALTIYLSGGRHMPPDTTAAAVAAKAAAPKLVMRDWWTIAAIIALLPILAVAFVGNNQIYNAYMIWARDNADLVFFGMQMPVTWLQSYDAAISVACLAGVVWFWRWMAARGLQPGELTKLIIGCMIGAVPFLLLATAATIQASTGAKVPIGWLLAFHFINSVAFSNLLPISLALVSRSAPPAVNATLIGVYYLLFVGANAMVGKIGGLYEQMSHVQFWLLHAGLCAGAGLALIILFKPLKAALTPAGASPG